MSKRPPRASVEVTDPRVLRGLAHPLRLSLLAALRLDGPSTATLLGQRLGESSGATSYHLRELHRFGFVEDAAGRGTGRERWWQAAHRSTSWTTSSFSGSDAAVADELEHRVVEVRSHLFAAWLEQRRTLPPPWADVGSFNDLPLHLAPEAAKRLAGELTAVLQRWRDTEGEEPGTPGTLVVQALADVFALTDYPLLRHGARREPR